MKSQQKQWYNLGIQEKFIWKTRMRENKIIFWGPWKIGKWHNIGKNVKIPTETTLWVEVNRFDTADVKRINLVHLPFAIHGQTHEVADTELPPS